MNQFPSKLSVRQHDFVLFAIMGILAGCGLIYEYLLSHYAGRILGAVEHVIFAMIGVMIVAMGLGAFAARIFKSYFNAFVWLEVSIALIGVSSVLVLAMTTALANILPQILMETFLLPPDLIPRGGMILWAHKIAAIMPYVVGFILGFLIGMEIPLIASIRETIYGEHVAHNAGSVYGADYIGAGIGAAIWVMFMLSLPPTTAAVITASVNLLIGLLFYGVYRKRIRFGVWVVSAHLLVAGVVIAIAFNGIDWDNAMEDLLYKDKVIFSYNTEYQHVTITERIMDPAKPKIVSMFINGRSQFASNDEVIYHAMLVAPVMHASARHDNILIIGGGDGLALRDVLRWQPQSVELIDIDAAIVQFFTTPRIEKGRVVNQALLDLNQHAFSDPRVQTHFGDAFLKVDELIQQQRLYDVIIVDLPDPSHPDLNKLYSARFYAKLKTLLTGDGAMVVQSTSPYHAKNTFLSIGKTVQYAGFMHVEQYHHNVPSFGEWGWTIATKNGVSAKARLEQKDRLEVNDGWSTRGVLLAAFEFNRHFFDRLENIKVNRINNQAAYQYHKADWEKQQGIYIIDK
ncbi:MAG: polyamine aminopropyltransferase [Gammaproteobacteria bacterium]|nr:polyamine aminopropyltransferase [Gammaproteobacteria bacterium]MCF6259746.1 polyamine aminopropyltransferase [Gammaproteobacteria bacterium]